VRTSVPSGLVTHLGLDVVDLREFAERLVHEIGDVVDHKVDEPNELVDVPAG
jgi:hypothetical protein